MRVLFPADIPTHRSRSKRCTESIQISALRKKKKDGLATRTCANSDGDDNQILHVVVVVVVVFTCARLMITSGLYEIGVHDSDLEYPAISSHMAKTLTRRPELSPPSAMSLMASLAGNPSLNSATSWRYSETKRNAVGENSATRTSSSSLRAHKYVCKRLSFLE